jgi:WD40 repeat protein
VAFSPDGSYALSGSLDTTLRLWDVATGKEIRSFAGHTYAVNSVVFSPDGKYALSGSGDSTLRLWDVATGKEIRSFAGHTDSVRSVAFSPDGRYALSGSYFDDTSTRIWNIATGKEIAQFISFTDGEWVVITPKGYFNASPNGAKHLNVRVGNYVYSIDNFYKKFFNPAYVAAALQGKKVEAKSRLRSKN